MFTNHCKYSAIFLAMLMACTSCNEQSDDNHKAGNEQNPPTCENGNCDNNQTDNGGNNQTDNGGQDTSCKTPGFVNCNGTCIDPNKSKLFCGANEYCEGFEVCESNQICQDGHCTEKQASSCKTEGYVKCDGTCINPMNAIAFCGADENCENYEICESDQTCQDGHCTEKQASSCKTEGYVKCNGTCIDPMKSKQFCGANTNCEGFEVCESNQICQDGHCTGKQTSACKSEGFVKCDGTCINPLASIAYCGANENCEGYTTCKDTETCTKGRCRPTSCESDEHFHDEICEKDSLDNCGEHNYKCEDKVEGWISGKCENKKCMPSRCIDGQHPFENSCEPDDITHCGSHDINCSVSIAGWAEGSCENQTCQVSACQNGLHLFGNTCETDDPVNCGTHANSCSLLINGWATGECIQASCSVRTCNEGYHVYDNTCEPDTSAGQCKKNDEDGDTIADEDEGREENVDTDEDGDPDYLDSDSDNDTIPDSIEARNGGNPCQEPAATSMIPDFRSTDSDNNGIPDSIEAGHDTNNPVDTDGDTIPDYADEDNDGDLILDLNEIYGLIAGVGTYQHPGRKCDEHCMCGDDGWCNAGTPDSPWDSDGDGTPDYMDKDTNNDGVKDLYKSDKDRDGDGVMDVYSTDSDGDTISDKDEFGNGETPVDTDNDGLYDFQDMDSDSDGLRDSDEVDCPSLNKHSRIFVDTDGDEQSDMAEYILAMKNDKEPSDYICDSTKTVLDFVDFYVELSTKETEGTKSIPMIFHPVMTRADVLLNIDNTGSMGSTIQTLRQYFSDMIMPVIRENVKESWFGLSIFRDFDASPVWQLRQEMTANEETFNTKFSDINASNASTDAPEAGYESLYEIATGDVSASNVNQAYGQVGNIKPEGIGGVGFRKGSMPIILHITDASSHEIKNGNGHDAQTTFEALKQIGARVLPINITSITSDSSEKDKLLATGQRMASSTNAVVPVCAYHRSNGWVCGNNKCCTDPYNDASIPGTPNGVAPDSNNNCVLSLDVGGRPADAKFNGENLLAYKTMLAVEALIKYGTYNVSTNVVGEPFEEGEAAGEIKDTSCFIDHVEAVSYTPPSNAIVSQCLAGLNTAPKDFSGKGYYDGFENFAFGVTASDEDMSKLEFKIYAKNNHCVHPSPNVRSYRATIQIWDSETKLVFDEHEIIILVPGVEINVN